MRHQRIILSVLTVLVVLSAAAELCFAQQEPKKELKQKEEQPTKETAAAKGDQQQIAPRPAEETLKAADPQEILERAKEQMQNLRYGGMPDDALAPYRPLLRPFAREPECQAGKICEKIEKEKTDKAECDER